MRSKAEKTIIWTAIFGVLVAAYALTLHYSGGESICNINERFDCDVVNKSKWAELFGMPVALLGMLTYALVAILALKRKSVQQLLDFTAKDFWQYVFILVVVMFAFQAYLTYVEIFFLKTYCIVCLISQVTVLLLLGMSIWAYVRAD